MFTIAISEKQLFKGLFGIGDEIKGTAWTKQYEARGARILSKTLWKIKCFKFSWANMANVEIQYDFDKNIKNTDSKPFVMDLNLVFYTKWV
jgi:hypothetical protein